MEMMIVRKDLRRSNDFDKPLKFQFLSNFRVRIFPSKCQSIALSVWLAKIVRNGHSHNGA